MIDNGNEPLLPLILATLILAGSMGVARLRHRWPLWIQVTARIISFAILTILVQRLLGSPLAPHYSAVYSGKDLWEHVIEAGWWILAARLGVVLVRLFVVLEHRPRESQIVSDLMAGGIYLATLLAIVNYVFAVPIAGLVATSGVIAIVLGLALQNTLSDVFSGIAVGLEHPFHVGDRVTIGDYAEGVVVQMNWRSIQVQTDGEDLATIPNSLV